MEELWYTIQGTTLPSTMSPPPANFGSARHGKLKAAQWRSLCTIILPVVLVRVWGSEHSSPIAKSRLENFMHLVISIRAAMWRTTSRSRVFTYLSYMRSYLQGLQNLYPKHKNTPNHHAALHLAEYLLRFGPMCSWWCFPYEGYNGMLQRKKTNSKPGESYLPVFHSVLTRQR